MTNQEARAHCEERITLFKAELYMLATARENGERWSLNRGAGSALSNLDQLIKNYERITRVIADLPEEKQHEAVRTFDSLEKSDTDPKWEIMKNGLFGYYQNGVDYLTQFAQVHGWTPVEHWSNNSIAYEHGQYRIELSMIQATGVDLSKETYLFDGVTSDEKENANQGAEVSTSPVSSGD